MTPAAGSDVDLRAAVAHLAAIERPPAPTASARRPSGSPSAARSRRADAHRGGARPRRLLRPDGRPRGCVRAGGDRRPAWRARRRRSSARSPRRVMAEDLQGGPARWLRSRPAPAHDVERRGRARGAGRRAHARRRSPTTTRPARARLRPRRPEARLRARALAARPPRPLAAAHGRRRRPARRSSRSAPCSAAARTRGGHGDLAVSAGDHGPHVAPAGGAGRQRQPHRRRGVLARGRAACCGGDGARGLRIVLLSRRAARRPTRRACSRFARRHFGELDRERTTFLCLDTVGSPELVLHRARGLADDADYDAATKDRSRARRARRASGAPRAALLLRDRRAHPAAARATASAVLGSVNQPLVAHELPLRRPITPDNVVFRDVADAVGVGRSAVVERLSRRADAAAPAPRRGPPVGRRTSPAYRASASAASSRPSSGPGSMPSALASVVAAQQRRRPRRRRPPGAAPAPQDLARELDVPGDRLLGLAAPRGEPVGDGQQRDVDLDRLGRREVAVQRPRASQRPAVHEEAEAQVVAGERRDVRAQALARLQPA